MDPKDLSDFFQKFVKDYEKGKDDKISKFVGDKNVPSKAQGEATLDVEYIMGPIGGKIQTQFWQWTNFDLCGDIYEWTNLILKTKNAPTVWSVSYGEQGNITGPDGVCALEKIKAIDNNFAKLAAKGISILVSSGDDGTGWYPSDDKCGEN